MPITDAGALHAICLLGALLSIDINETDNLDASLDRLIVIALACTGLDRVPYSESHGISVNSVPQQVLPMVKPVVYCYCELWLLVENRHRNSKSRSVSYLVPIAYL